MVHNINSIRWCIDNTEQSVVLDFSRALELGQNNAFSVPLANSSLMLALRGQHKRSFYMKKNMIKILQPPRDKRSHSTKGEHRYHHWYHRSQDFLNKPLKKGWSPSHYPMGKRTDTYTRCTYTLQESSVECFLLNGCTTECQHNDQSFWNDGVPLRKRAGFSPNQPESLDLHLWSQWPLDSAPEQWK